MQREVAIIITLFSMFQIRQLFLYRVSSDFSQDLMVKFLVSYRVKNMSLQNGSHSQLLKVTLL
jgi:hypothetical protein